MRLRSNIPAHNVNFAVQENFSVEFAKNPLSGAGNSNTSKPKSQGRNMNGRFAQTFEKRSRGLAFSQITGDTA